MVWSWELKWVPTMPSYLLVCGQNKSSNNILILYRKVARTLKGGGALLLNVNNNIISHIIYILGDSMFKHIKKDGTSVKHLVTL